MNSTQKQTLKVDIPTRRPSRHISSSALLPRKSTLRALAESVRKEREQKKVQFEEHSSTSVSQPSITKPPKNNKFLGIFKCCFSKPK